MRTKRREVFRSLLVTGLMLLAAAIYVQWSARRAERSNPPRGEFLKMHGTRLHYIDTKGRGPAVVLLHGNGSMARELEISGMVESFARDYRVIAFDRPGFGYSERPRNIAWTPAAQAEVIAAALYRLGVKSVIIVGHSWGNLVAAELALRHPGLIKGLVLVGGFYFPIPRADVTLISLLATPVLGDLLRYTISPLIARAVAPFAVAKIFKPQPVSERFAEQFPTELALRPVNLRASVEDLAMMMPAAATLETRYPLIRQPTIIIAGSGDRIVDTREQSVRLHRTILNSVLDLHQNDGHMIHYHASHAIKQAVDRLTARLLTRRKAS
jgi:pimeloyl-ACP methyl ester carboxylesterase